MRKSKPLYSRSSGRLPVRALRARMGFVGVPREELEAALEARRELGVERERELVEGFLDRIERGLDRRIDERLAERRPAAPARREPSLSVTIVSLCAAIPLIAIAGSSGGVPAIFLIC